MSDSPIVIPRGSIGKDHGRQKGHTHDREGEELGGKGANAP